MVLEKLMSDFGGNLHKRSNKPTMIWTKNLGKNEYGAHKFIRKMMGFMCLDCKYDKLEKMNVFYKQLAETKQTESDKGM